MIFKVLKNSLAVYCLCDTHNEALIVEWEEAADEEGGGGSTTTKWHHIRGVGYGEGRG